MAWNRALYLCALFLTFLGLVFQSDYLFFVLTIIILLLPFISLIITLPFYSKCGIKIRFNSDLPEAKAGSGSSEIISIRIEADSHAFPLLLDVNLKNLFYDVTDNHKIYLSGEKDHFIWNSEDDGAGCGIVRLSVTKLRMLDLLGLWRLPVPLPDTKEFLVKPERTAFSKWSLEELICEDNEFLSHIRMQGRSGDREVRDIRGYRPGDSLRDIHWKLSARRDDFVVREYENQSVPMVLAAIHWTGPPWRLESAIGQLLGIADFLEACGQPFLLLLFEEKQFMKTMSLNTQRTVKECCGKN